jgi:hypothetical protein
MDGWEQTQKVGVRMGVVIGIVMEDDVEGYSEESMVIGKVDESEKVEGYLGWWWLMKGDGSQWVEEGGRVEEDWSRSVSWRWLIKVVGRGTLKDLEG